MKQVNLVEQLTKIKLAENNYKKNIDDRNIDDRNDETNNIIKKEICNTYLIPLLTEYFVDKIPIFSDVLQIINDKDTFVKKCKDRYEFIKMEKATTFFYQTCLNFVYDYINLILTQKFSEQTKKELIINAFIYSDFGSNLLKTYQDFEDFEDGCHISIDLHEISK